MSVGYPDYARLSEEGGYLLFGGSGVINKAGTMFQGYVGSWPYLTMFTELQNSADFAKIALAYYTDSTFATLAGFRYVIRTGASFAITQYANMSPWLIASYDTQSGASMNFVAWAMYGIQGPATPLQLASADVPIFSFNQVVAAGGNVTVQPQHIQPGDAILTLYTTSTKWHAQMMYYDYTAGSYLQTAHFDNSWAVSGQIFDMPMLDAPHQFVVTNDDTVAHQFVASWVSK